MKVAWANEPPITTNMIMEQLGNEREWKAQTTITMSLLALFYIAVTPLLLRRYSAKGCYYAWFIVIIGLIIPFRLGAGNAIVKVNVPGEPVIAHTGSDRLLENVAPPLCHTSCFMVAGGCHGMGCWDGGIPCLSGNQALSFGKDDQALGR